MKSTSPPLPAVRTGGRFTWVPTAVGTFIGVIATLSLIASVSPTFRSLIHTPREFVNDYLFNFPDTSFAWAFVLALLAAALGARKRIAWWIAMLYLAASIALNIAGLRDPRVTAAGEVGELIGLVTHIVALVLVGLSYRQFWARVRRGALFKAAATLGAGMLVGIGVGWALVELFPGSLAPSDRLPYVVNRVVAFAGFGAETFTGHTHVWVNALLGLFGALALMAAAIVLFQSQRADNALTGSDEAAIRGLLDEYGRNDSLGYFATRRDKSVIFAPNGRAAITYRVEVGVCLASGDPIGDPRAWPAAVGAWTQLCETYGWAPGVMGASAAGARAYAGGGLNAMVLGDEAVIHPDRFGLSGPDMKPVRQAVTRARRAGLSVRIRRHRDLSSAEMAAVIAHADAWRDTETERGFSMALGRLGDPGDGDCLLVEAVRADAEVVAMLSLVPWGPNGVSLDLMRRSRQSPNGTIELMVSELALRGGELGIARISLNFAMFRSAFEQGAQFGAGPVARLWRKLLVFFSRWWQLETLYRSNMKYLPEWVPRYACYADARLIPRVGVASVIAEGFLVLPLSRRGQPHTGQHPSAPDEPRELASAPADAEPTPERLPEQVRVRMAKLTALQNAGVDAYPVGRAPTHTVADAAAADEGAVVRVAGRILRVRDYGGVLFADLRDWSGEVQLLLEEPAGAEAFTAAIDLGDLVEVTGTVGRSRTGTRSVLVTQWRLIGKCLRPLPDKWKGLADPEARVRARYLDLAVNPEARDLVRARSQILHAIRSTLVGHGFLEVETPILQQIHGGANARPFRTHINAYDLDLYLRIAPELYLKRLCVGGVERVFELGRAFRNEGVDFSHNPEFTLLEAYQAHADYLSWIDGARELIQNAAIAANGSATVWRTGPDGTLAAVDISGQWPVITVHDAVSAALGEQIDADTPLATLRKLSDTAGIGYRPGWDAGAVVLELYEHLVEDRTEEPTFYIDFPASVSPLTRPHRSRPGLAERWDLVAWGVELGTAYSELTDPVLQRRRLRAQSLLAAGGDPEAMELDEDFLTALEYAMPPTGGLGMGVDRVVMLITGRSIRETLPFPLAKPH
ncbi:bifunctional lysylphosphatidylglycerol synthetase/lysine--tRNA ligase LysX [Mycolicibacterium brumae]|uniref:Lysine--tRNA ligase n=1 Tax=Mycolicibacterium brumae TaxID=85968 RepID=A0A2G5P7D2_9MYCO|nr:bifunctional lysylphosphatidylglycerol synthetase/lysine--tRNA ligase LysX [Mycolicibacterium brumae]MCV7194558.1 bifunctional lysylphosphatidylglycerol synthetase/lysine--tRNA ligase LysX [Mycolicibacterium brumae]PIB74167.1 lysine--tRNA ligase [Mycolicibacterium brumae]RWA23003.1 lysyl-tRNA synthetase [Mycolicibacterium brumae DSM 44177]UWW08898.1 bifunctional lysylphosphatidylglycerol synthetase/lysine--tRNA ligase LysX [Mycolicibacterium brumae]